LTTVVNSVLKLRMLSWYVCIYYFQMFQLICTYIIFRCFSWYVLILFSYVSADIYLYYFQMFSCYVLSLLLDV
jgi:hypothetical protein